ncbi:Predicted transcriptional regulator [Serratia quinivorans]|uniref:HVO_A0114 family putative DNA-binding protein n=1 Tax=Serratia quinivorans TaxID=137545 RepID=UPI00217B8D27|nr:transcriptional regulator [Serratia quinivorans]CAI0924138.1 Predicted transcriptional regulator [Serratia quinivorans]CAI1096486.1 Predicted transcriptional regulator [Serratia quinivorans]CAI1097007.1 Predicted transcriptional regulator [Serratia quinivorans]CAI1148797.1 Predicted transcriptional regulator [Serratia quinivorans]CAI1161796.1 Predicted transcriptional regulator [Serratia quinivorans]
MRTLMVSVMPVQQAIDGLKTDLSKALSGADMGSRLIFPDVKTLTYVLLNNNRMTLLEEMTGAEAMSIRELSRRVNRDFKAVHTDVQALLNAGVLDKKGSKIIFSYDEIHFDFVTGKAA